MVCSGPFLIFGEVPSERKDALMTGSAAIKYTKKRSRAKDLIYRIWKYRWLYLILLPGMIYYIVFNFGPLPFLRIAFQKYSPQLELLGQGSPWMDPWYRNFQVFFSGKDFMHLLRNTLWLSVLGTLIGFPVPIILALMLNEMRNARVKRTLQSSLYLPHFISWAVLASIVMMLIGPAPNGLVNSRLRAAGKPQIPFLESNEWFRPVYIIEGLWKGSGWGTIIYLSALSGVDEQLYEAAVIDGAGRWKQMLHITLPAISSTIVINLILKMGSFFDNGFDQIYLLQNSLNRDVAEVFDTYIYEVGLCGTFKPARDISTYSYASAIGIVKSVVSTGLVIGTNALANLIGDEGLF